MVHVEGWLQRTVYYIFMYTLLVLHFLTSPIRDLLQLLGVDTSYYRGIGVALKDMSPAEINEHASRFAERLDVRGLLSNVQRMAGRARA